MMRSSEAVQLFVEQAQRQQPGFDLTIDRASPIAQLCIHLDGIPLALELAAARVRSLTIDEINARLNDRFKLLTGGARTALPRQQTLRATLDWSYDLLRETEKAHESGEEARWRNRHLEYFLALAEEAEPQLTGADQQAWLDRLEMEHDNLRSALGWSSATGGDAAGGLRLAGAFWRFWYVRGYVSEGRGWLSGLLGCGTGRAGCGGAREGAQRGRRIGVAAERLRVRPGALRGEPGDPAGAGRPVGHCQLARRTCLRRLRLSRARPGPPACAVERIGCGRRSAPR